MTTATLDPPTAAPEVTPITFTAVKLPLLDEELARLNKIAAKLGVEPLSYTITERGTKTVEVDAWLGPRYDPETGTYKIRTIEVETVTVIINGTTPMLPGGWKFLGSIEFLPAASDGTPLALVHGDDERLAAYRDAGPVCDHCGYRRNRKKVVVLESAEADVTVVGSSCLKDFLGYHGNPEKVLRFYDDLGAMLGDLDDEDGGEYFGPRVRPTMPTEIFLGMAVAMVREFGWVPKSSYSGVPTATRLSDRFFPPSKPSKEDREYFDEINAVEVTDSDLDKAKAVRAWANTAADESRTNNYIGNLAVALAGSYLDVKHFGIAASAVGAYDKALGLEIKRDAEKKAAASSEWVGTVGKREVFTGTVTAVIPYETMYGTGRVVKMLDADGNTLKSLTSGAWAYGLVVGDEVTVKATVKSHDTWNGAKETNLTRAALVK